MESTLSYFGVCGTDIDFFQAAVPLPPPMQLYRKGPNHINGYPRAYTPFGTTPPPLHFELLRDSGYEAKRRNWGASGLYPPSVCRSEN